MTAPTITSLATRAAEVATRAADQDAAFQEQQAAEVGLLERVVELVRPALEALSSRPVVAWSPWGIESRAEWAGVWLSIDGPDSSGRSLSLWLRADGQMIGLVSARSGSDTTSHEEPLTIAQVAGRWSVEGIIRALSLALDRELAGRRVQITEQVRNRAERLRALARLL